MFHSRSIMMICFLLIAIGTGATNASAGAFKRTKTLTITYAWGATSLADFDQWNSDYPGYLPVAILTLYPDGTFDALDLGSGSTGGGVYDKRGSNLTITIVPDGPYGTVEYVGTRVARKKYAGAIEVGGESWGIWRGDLQ